MPKIILYCEYLKFFNGILFRNSAMGFLTSYYNQKEALKIQKIDFTEDLKTSADIFQANAQGLRTIYLIKKFKRRGMKTIIYAHATAEELSGGFRLLHFFTLLYRHYLTYVYSLADIVICPSVYTQELLQKKYNIPKEKTVFISNGVNIHKFNFNLEKRIKFRKEQDIAQDKIAIINVAMAIKKKGIETFIFLAKAYPQVKFFWFGKIFKDILTPKLPASPQNMFFCGYVKDIVSAYCAADIFLFPSYEENQGISVLEAGAIGLPIIIRDIPVYQGWMQDGVNCLKAKNNNEFQAKIKRLVEDETLRKQLGESAHQMVMQEHSLESIGEKLKTVYQRLLIKK